MNRKLIKFLRQISKGSIKYKDPSFLNLKEIDPKIRSVIKNINSSNWCRTLWSCQGHHHDDGSATNPYLTFVVDNDKINLFLELIYNTLPIYKSKSFPIATKYNLQIHLGHSNKYFSIISIYWSSNFIDSRDKNYNFYTELKHLGRKISQTK